MIASSNETSGAGRRAPRHILYVIDELDSLQGGAERSLWLTTRLLPPDRYRASVLTLKHPADPSCPRQFPCPVHVLPLDRTYDWRALKAAFRVRRLIQSERVEIVQTLFESSDLWGGLVAKLSGCRVLISSRRDMGFRRVGKHDAGYRLLNPLFDRIHTVSDAVRDYTIRHDRADPRKVITIPNGVDLERIASADSSLELRARYGLETASHLIVDVTTVRRVKGLDVLIRTAAEVCRAFPRAMFLVIGAIREPDYFAELNGLVDELGLGSTFRFVGGLQPVFPLLKQCDIFCHLSRTDGLSNAVLEAMACGLPCVVTRVGGNPETVEEGRSGFVVSTENPELAADRIITLLRYPDCARHLAERARQIVNERFTAVAMVSRLVELYDQLLQIKPANGVNTAAMELVSRDESNPGSWSRPESEQRW